MNRLIYLCSTILILSAVSMAFTPEPALYPEVEIFLSSLKKKYKSIDPQRDLEVQKLSQLILRKKLAKQPVNIVFISANNSSTDLLAQVIVQASAALYGYTDIKTFSAAVDPGAIDPRVGEFLSKNGFKVSQAANGYTGVRFSDMEAPVELHSKNISDSGLPTVSFSSVIVCGDNQSCSPIDHSEFAAKIPLSDLSQIKEQDKFESECKRIAVEISYSVYNLRNSLRK